MVTISWALISWRFKRIEAHDRGHDRSDAPPTDVSDPALPIFPNYIQLRSQARLSPRFWSWLRFGAVVLTIIYIGVLFVDPDDGLWLWWQITIPLLPLLFLVAPGVWRNVCPLAASNQLPRVFNFSRALTPPKWLTEYGFVMGVAAFFLFATSRKWLFNHNGPATGLLIIAAMVGALLGGYLFKGKSGWCSSICPLYPVQRFYNRTPLATVPNAHCTPCVGCTKNCYDFNPKTAYLADMYDDDRHAANYRKFFAAAMPGFIVAYFTMPDPVGLTAVITMYLQFALYMVLSIGMFTVLDTFFKGSSAKLTAVYGAVALNLFYGFGLPNWFKAVDTLFVVPLPTWLLWLLQAGILITSVVWVVRTFRTERLYLRHVKPDETLRVAVSADPIGQTPQAEITFMPAGLRVPADASRTLLEVAESSQQPIKSGCRMGICGADPILVVEGMEHLGPLGSDEKSTLERLGLGENCRLACMCRPTGAVSIALDPNAVVTPIAPATSTAASPLAEAVEVAVSAPPPSKPMNPSAITFMPMEVEVPIEAGRTLLDIAENHNQPIEAGCRMGICGADPVLIMKGMENLPPISKDEKATLERLGLGGNCRLACMCRVKGPVTVSLETKGAAAATAAPIADYDRSLKSIVIIGNGAAGITAADTVRRFHPECEIHLVSREKHHFYNRMAITRLIYGRSAMSGLYMQSEAWYDERKITCWLNTHATHINRGRKHVILATGETLAYDRLILATGSSCFVPPIPGYGLPGSFVLREAEEAMEIRAYIQKHQCRTAVIAGGGLLGLETAYALHKMGLTVCVLERGEWLLRRQLDERGGQYLKEYLEALGLTVETSAEAACVEGEDRVSTVTLKDGRALPCDVFMVAAGIQPNIDLARAAGLNVNRGVVVDEAMRTSALDIFAAGDVCEYQHQLPGLWAVALEQAKVAAINAVGGQSSYAEAVPVTALKVAGADLTSMGQIEARSDIEVEIAQEAVGKYGYRKLIIAAGKLVGAIMLGDAPNTPAIAEAVKERRDVSQYLDALRAGHWEVLRDDEVDTTVAAKWTTCPPAPRSASAPKPALEWAKEAASPAKEPAVVTQPDRAAANPTAPIGTQTPLRVPRRAVRKVRLSSNPLPDIEPQWPVPPTSAAESLKTTAFRTIIIDFGKKRSQADIVRERMP